MASTLNVTPAGASTVLSVGLTNTNVTITALTPVRSYYITNTGNNPVLVNCDPLRQPTAIFPTTTAVTGSVNTTTGGTNLIGVSSTASLTALQAITIAGNATSQGGLSNGVYFIINPNAGPNSITVANSAANAALGTAVTLTTATVTNVTFTVGGPQNGLVLGSQDDLVFNLPAVLAAQTPGAVYTAYFSLISNSAVQNNVFITPIQAS